MKIIIEKQISEDVTEPMETIDTTGYLIIYLKGETFKATGNIGLNDLAPILLKLAMDKVKK